MATEQVSIEAMIEGTDTAALQKMRNELDNLGRTGKRAGETASQGMQQMDRGLNRIMDTMKGVLAAFGVVASAQAMVSFIRYSTAAFMAQEQAMRGVIVAGEMVGENYAMIEATASSLTAALQRRTGLGDEQQMVALRELITIIGDYRKSLEILPLVLDVVATHGLDMVSASRAIGLALRGNLGLIGRYIPALRGLAEEEKNAENITRILHETYSGRAEAMAETTTGKINIMKAQWGDLKERLGEITTFIVGDFAGTILPVLEKLGGSGGVIAKDMETGLRALLNFQSAKRPNTEKIEVPFEITETGAGIKYALETQLPQLARISELDWQRRSIQMDIKKELEAGGATIDSIIEKTRQLLDLNKKELEIRREINQLRAEEKLGRVEMIGELVGAAKEVEKKFPGALPEKRLAPGFYLSQALEEQEGITGLSQWREKQLRNILAKEGLPAAFRADIAQQLFRENLAQMQAAITPGVAATQFEEAFRAMEVAQAEKGAAIGEEIQRQQELIENTRISAEELKQIKGLMADLLSTVKVSGKGFENPKGREIDAPDY